jgi:hypothetical protein
LHDAAVRKAIPAQSWSLLEASLPWVSSSESWDDGLKLRRAVVKKCVDLPVNPEGFVDLVKSEQLFMELLDAVYKLWSGGRYLRAVRDWLDRSSNRSHARQRKVVKKFMKDRYL